MNSIWKVGAAVVTVALLGGFYLGRAASDPGPLPAVGQPVTVGATADPTPSAAATLTLHPRPHKTTSGRPEKTREHRPGDIRTVHATPDDHGGNSGRGGGSDDGGVRTISPSPSVVTQDDDGGFDDHGGGGNSGPG
jgi:hypothetical protein